VENALVEPLVEDESVADRASFPGPRVTEREELRGVEPGLRVWPASMPALSGP
jgi:hypothetical protein